MGFPIGVYFINKNIIKIAGDKNNNKGNQTIELIMTVITTILIDVSNPATVK